MNLNLPDSIASSQDIAGVSKELHDYSTWLSRQAIRQRVGSKNTAAQPELSPATQHVLHAWVNGKDPTPSALDMLLKSLDSHRRTAPAITITLAAAPTNDVKTKLVAWVRRELSSDTLVNFRVNRGILGGVVVAKGSHIFDWSFKRKIVQSNASFSEVLARV